MRTKPKSTLRVAISFNKCQIYRAENHLAINCPKYATSRPKCLKCGGLHRIENCGLKCNFCGGLGYTKESCWKKKDPKTSATIMNYLEIMIDDEEVVRNQLDVICENNQDLFSHTKIQRHRVLVDTMVGGQDEVDEKDLAQRKDVNIGLKKDPIIK